MINQSLTILIFPSASSESSSSMAHFFSFAYILEARPSRPFLFLGMMVALDPVASIIFFFLIFSIISGL